VGFIPLFAYERDSRVEIQLPNFFFQGHASNQVIDAALDGCINPAVQRLARNRRGSRLGLTSGKVTLQGEAEGQLKRDKK
jgi:hypothetical protein